MLLQPQAEEENRHQVHQQPRKELEHEGAVRHASRACRSTVLCSSAPRLVIKPTPIKSQRKHPQYIIESPSKEKLDTHVGAVERGAFRAQMQLRCPSPILRQEPTCTRCFTLPHLDRRTSPRAAELSVSTSTFILKLNFEMELPCLQCTCGTPKQPVNLRRSAAARSHFLRAGACSMDCPTEEMRCVH